MSRLFLLVNKYKCDKKREAVCYNIIQECFLHLCQLMKIIDKIAQIEEQDRFPISGEHLSKMTLGRALLQQFIRMTRLFLSMDIKYIFSLKY